MQKLRIVTATVMLVCLLVGVSQSVFAGPATQYKVNLKNATIPWFIPLTSACPEISGNVEINPVNEGSDRVKQATENVKPDGTKHIVITDLVKGTATDGVTTYKFLYENNATYDFDGSTVTVKMKDTFHLKGGAINYTVGFNWRWAYPASSLAVVADEEDIAVDPFIFATFNGTDPDPGIVPGSWQQLSTRGDILNCDPL